MQLLKYTKTNKIGSDQLRKKDRKITFCNCSTLCIFGMIKSIIENCALQN